ncbi:MAG TPA: hypothetical protein VGC79_01880, partial [Polyangiaceae bacterium]
MSSLAGMVGRSRVLGLERVLLPGAVAYLALGAGACIGHLGQPGPPPDTSEGAGGTTGSISPSKGAGATGSFGPSKGGAAGATGAPGRVPVGATGGFGCSLPPVTDKPVFAEQA